MKIDLDNIQEAMDWLSESPGGDQALKALADATSALEKAIPTELNAAEARYILERLMSQRRLVGQDEELELEEAEVTAFSMQPTAGLFPTETGVGRAQLPDYLQSNTRILNYGFRTLASIPSTTFKG